MSDDHGSIDLNKFEAFFAEPMRWATLFVTIQEIADDNKALVRDLSSYDPKEAIPLLASLLTLPEYQSHCIRLEILVALAVAFCKGRKKANIGKAVNWFSQIGRSRCVAGEDPAEDVFVSLAQDRNGNYRLLEGVWEAAGFYTQRVMEVVSSMPDDGKFRQIKRSFVALLIISDMVCEKAGLQRYQLGSDEQHSTLLHPQIPSRNNLISRVSVTFEELNARGVNKVDIEPFLFQLQMKDHLFEQQIGCSYLDRYPLIIQSKDHLTVVLPTALSVAARDFVIANIIEGGLVEAFNDALARNYAKLFFNTPLLGGPTQAPIVWKEIGSHRISNFIFEIDRGYFISYHLFLPSVETHANGGFKSIYQDEGMLTNALQESVNSALEKISGRSEFKEGLVVLVGCGWGRGYATQEITLDHSKWRFQSMSGADLVRLSWLDDMKPSYFWRIQDGLEAITNGGVHIVNPNGILNLIGLVRSNEGHFVPHAQLPEGEISPERPLMLNPPLNLLREVRADADLGYDRHRAIDNIGTWHDVQHVSPNPFFNSESARRLYASMGDVEKGTLTSVYEGAVQLWISLETPNINERGVTYRLWEMANEWLHRIGRELDELAVHLAKKANVKVYVEFRDADPPKKPGEKPKIEDLTPLCIITEHEQQDACKAVFNAGFLSGFGIAENIAERLFVLNLTRAFLHLLDRENLDQDAEEIARRVVLNQEARSFHFFHAQHFLDYVRDSLPKTLVTIDKIDDAAAKIGLGWRAIDKNQGGKIEGREACTRFLNKVVDILLSEISGMLAAFERVSTLKRVVANNEKASAEEDHWRRTSAAIIGLHGHNKGTIDRYVEQVSKFAGAGITSRVLTEIALCVCPQDDGAQISDIELSKLIARAALTVRIGELSNAIYYNALSPEITISPLGDILFRDDFGKIVVQPMLSRALGDKFIENAPVQKKNYEEPGVIPTTQDKFEPEFWYAWKKEMGFDLDEARKIIGALEDKGIADHKAVFTITQSEYLSNVCSNDVPEDNARKFLDKFTLSTRRRWEKPPIGFDVDDIEPWRFGRRLSFVARPILKVDESDDPLLIIAPSALRKGFIYVLDGAYRGRLKQSFFQSEELRDTWWGKASEGHSFNDDVAQRLAGAGWQTRGNIGLPELLNRKIEKDYGDVDVLAWRQDRKEVFVIECKDLSFARNYSEIAALLSDYQGKEDSKGKPDKLKMHLTRVSMLEDNIDQMQRFTGIQSLKVVSCLVCSGIVPMQYAKIEALAKTHVGSIEDIMTL
ncbi:MAG: hypothetical protein OXN16_08045 [Gammaproteobacteria bacterium]|nr:hypothetical protein [Gammaproteobacteria bacterium]